MTWREALRTRPQAVADPQVPRETIAAWPEPCPVCGALHYLTPANRWHIDHFYGPHHTGERKRFVA